VSANLKLLEHIESKRIQVIAFSLAYLASTMGLGRQIHSHSIYADAPFDEEKLAKQLLWAGTDKSPDRYFRIAVRGDVVLGAFYGYVHRVFFSDQLVANDLGWWVREEARGGRTAMALLLDFEKWAKQQGAKRVGLGQTGVEDIERTTQLFVHCGYKVIGYNTMKDL
jgi:hypothetical protein